jgi:hypothetical protein
VDGKTGFSQFFSRLMGSSYPTLVRMENRDPMGGGVRLFREGQDPYPTRNKFLFPIKEAYVMVDELRSNNGISRTSIGIKRPTNPTHEEAFYSKTVDQELGSYDGVDLAGAGANHDRFLTFIASSVKSESSFLL